MGKSLEESPAANPTVTLRYDPAAGNIGVVITNHGKQPCTVTVSDELYRNEPPRTHPVAPGQSIEDYRLLKASAQWYNFTIQIRELAGYQRRLAGHMETGRDSTSDPAMSSPRAVWSPLFTG